MIGLWEDAVSNVWGCRFDLMGVRLENAGSEYLESGSRVSIATGRRIRAHSDL